MSLNVGFIGLGNMGNPMAKNVLLKNSTLMVWDIDKAKCQAFLSDGVLVAENLVSLTKYSDVIFLSLPGPTEVEKVMLSEEGLLSQINNRQFVVIDLSTIDPTTSESMAEVAKNRGVIYIDVPVSGGVPKAIDGTLTMMVGATKEEVKGVLPLLEAIGATFHYIGKRGGGVALKLINNFMAACNMFIAAEAILMADHLNVPFETFYNVVSTSSGASQVLASKKPKIESGDFEPGFALDLMIKDLELAIQLCKDSGIANFSANIVQQWYRIAQLHGLGKKDMSSIVKLLREIEPV